MLLMQLQKKPGRPRARKKAIVAQEWKHDYPIRESRNSTTIVKPVVEVNRANEVGNGIVEKAIHDEMHNRTEYDSSFDHRRDFTDCNEYC